MRSWRSTSLTSAPPAPGQDRHADADADAEAVAVAVAVLSKRATAVAKAGAGAVEMARVFKLAKASAVKSRTQVISQLKAVVVIADPALRESLTGLSTVRLVRRGTELAGDPRTVPEAATHTLRLLTRRITHLTEEIDDLDERLAETLDAHAPALLSGAALDPTPPRRC